MKELHFTSWQSSFQLFMENIRVSMQQTSNTLKISWHPCICLPTGIANIHLMFSKLRLVIARPLVCICGLMGKLTVESIEVIYLQAIKNIFNPFQGRYHQASIFLKATKPTKFFFSSFWEKAELESKTDSN